MNELMEYMFPRLILPCHYYHVVLLLSGGGREVAGTADG